MINLHEIYQAIHHPIVVYILLVVLTRIIGKKLLGQLTFYDFVLGISLGTIGGAYVVTEVKGYYVLLSAVVMALMIYFTGIITLKSVTLRKLIEGEPIILIEKGKILESNMKKIRYNQDDLMMQLRSKDIFDFSQVEFAILEPHGELSIQRKSQYQPIAKKDLNLYSPYEGISVELIRDGRIQQRNLEENNITHEWLYNQLSSNNVKKIDDVFLATLYSNGNLYIEIS